MVLFVIFDGQQKNEEQAINNQPVKLIGLTAVQ